MCGPLAFVVAGLLASSIQAFVPGNAPIQWMRSLANEPVKPRVLIPQGFARRWKIRRTQKLTLTSPLDIISPGTTPYFSVKADQTIVWDGMDWCIEADKATHDVRVNLCTGGPAQKWNWIPSADGRNMIQLKSSHLCLHIDQECVLDEVPIVLRECGDGMQSWKFEAPVPLPTSSPSKGHVLAADMRHVMVSLYALVVLGSLGFSAWSWWRHTKARTATSSPGSVPMSAEQVALESVFARSAMLEGSFGLWHGNRFESAVPIWRGSSDRYPPPSRAQRRDVSMSAKSKVRRAQRRRSARELRKPWAEGDDLDGVDLSQAKGPASPDDPTFKVRLDMRKLINSWADFATAELLNVNCSKVEVMKNTISMLVELEDLLEDGLGTSERIFAFTDGGTSKESMKAIAAVSVKYARPLLGIVPESEASEVVVIEYLVANPMMQQKGFGIELIRRIISWATDAGRLVALWPANDRLQEHYEGLGFEILGPANLMVYRYSDRIEKDAPMNGFLVDFVP